MRVCCSDKRRPLSIGKRLILLGRSISGEGASADSIRFVLIRTAAGESMGKLLPIMGKRMARFGGGNCRLGVIRSVRVDIPSVDRLLTGLIRGVASEFSQSDIQAWLLFCTDGCNRKYHWECPERGSAVGAAGRYNSDAAASESMIFRVQSG